MSKILQTRVQNKHDTTANWEKATNFIPLAGEIIIYDDTHKIKIGDGESYLKDIKYIDETCTQSISELTNKMTNLETTLANTVRYDISQELTEEQKLQAMTNIGIEITTDDAMMLVIETGLVDPAAADDGSVYIDENGALYSL